MNAKMEAIINQLYSQFLFRDVLSYMVPGIIAIWLVAYALTVPIHLRGMPAIIGLCFAGYVSGLALQALGTWGYDDPNWPFLRFFPIGQPSIEEHKFDQIDSLYAESQWSSIPISERQGYASKRMERFTALKQIHGNVSAAFALGVIAFLWMAARSTFTLSILPFQKRMQTMFKHRSNGLPVDTQKPLASSALRQTRSASKSLLACLGCALAAVLMFHENQRLMRKEQVWRLLMVRKWKATDTVTTSSHIDTLANTDERLVLVIEKRKQVDTVTRVPAENAPRDTIKLNQGRSRSNAIDLLRR